MAIDSPGPLPKDAAARVRAIADRDSVRALEPGPASPWLSRYGFDARAGDGLTTARGAIGTRPVLFAAQDPDYLAGTIGAMHADALRTLLLCAQSERPAAVVLLFASAGVRLHEANAAELALGRTLRTLLDVRAAGVPVLGVAVGDVFGGASILAAACDRLALLPAARFGLSGPKVVETAAGRSELDAGDDGAVRRLYGAEARTRTGVADLLADDRDALRAWIGQGVRDAIAFPLRVIEMQERLAARVVAAGDDEPAPGWVEPDGDWLRLRAARGPFGPRQAIAADAALLAADDGDLARPRTLLIVEDSAGHPATRSAEALAISQYLAHHAAVLALLRSRGHRIVGYLAGTGHSAAFFVNALQADELYAAPGASVVAMAPEAVARVTGLDREHLARAIVDDVLFGHPVRHFASLGGVVDVLADEAAVRARLSARRRA
jgi:malonate decarboxylase beta subunit